MSPATTTAITPEAPLCSATIKEPHASTIVIAFSRTWSLSRLRIQNAIKPKPNPNTTPRPATCTNCITPSTIERFAAWPSAVNTAASKIKNRTTPVPSLNRLSPSMSVRRRRGAFAVFSVARTEIGSVGASIAPNNNAGNHAESPRNGRTANATSTIERSTPGIARMTTGTAFFCNNSRSRCNPAWNKRGGSNKTRIKTANTNNTKKRTSITSNFI